MKFFLGLLVGIAVGIGGEFLIPKQYQMNLTHSCIISTETDNVFMPVMFLYNRFDSDYPISLYDPEFNMKSYELAFEFLLGRVRTLSTEECNDIHGLYYDSPKEYK